QKELGKSQVCKTHAIPSYRIKDRVIEYQLHNN
ncbi:MAG: hypothetical protein EZS28_052540, partial [Streblomastix strix]